MEPHAGARQISSTASWLATGLTAVTVQGMGRPSPKKVTRGVMSCANAAA